MYSPYDMQIFSNYFKFNFVNLKKKSRKLKTSKSAKKGNLFRISLEERAKAGKTVHLTPTKGKFNIFLEKISGL